MSGRSKGVPPKDPVRDYLKQLEIQLRRERYQLASSRMVLRSDIATARAFAFDLRAAAETPYEWESEEHRHYRVWSAAAMLHTYWRSNIRDQIGYVRAARERVADVEAGLRLARKRDRELAKFEAAMRRMRGGS